MAWQTVIPSDDWELNIVLLKIARELSEDDFESIKFLCSGTKGIPKGVLERLTTPEKLFTHLRERGMVSQDNLLLLQAFLWHVGRHDLHELAADFARRLGNTLHFYSPTGEPENGFRYIKFHVAGNLDKFQREELESMRANVARLLFVPPEFVFLCGVEPSNSLILTFMVHACCVQVLKGLVTSHGNQFRKLGIDTLYVEDEILAVSESSSNLSEGPTAEGMLTTLYNEAKQLEERLERSEIKSLEKQDKIECTEKQVERWKERENYFRGLLCAALDSGQQHPTSKNHSDPIPLRTSNGRLII